MMQWIIWICLIPDVSGTDVALGAGAILATGDEQLFGVVTNVHYKD